MPKKKSEIIKRCRTALRDHDGTLSNTGVISYLTVGSDSRGAALAVNERGHQMECWDDTRYSTPALAELGAYLAMPEHSKICQLIGQLPDWMLQIRLKVKDDRIAELTVASALLMAEIDRLLEIKEIFHGQPSSQGKHRKANRVPKAPARRGNGAAV